jgi:Flp pilus assembly protein TadB
VPAVVRAAVAVATAPARARRSRGARARMHRELPVAVDLVGVAAGSGCTPYQAVEVAERWSPDVLRAPLRSVLRACALGASFEDALRDGERSVPVLAPLLEVLRSSARLGTPMAPALERLAADVRADVRREAEARARTVPVRLLFPLVFLVLPAFVLLTVLPAVAGGMRV